MGTLSDYVNDARADDAGYRPMGRNKEIDLKLHKEKKTKERNRISAINSATEKMRDTNNQTWEQSMQLAMLQMQANPLLKQGQQPQQQQQPQPPQRAPQSAMPGQMPVNPVASSPLLQSLAQKYGIAPPGAGQAMQPPMPGQMQGAVPGAQQRFSGGGPVNPAAATDPSWVDYEALQKQPLTNEALQNLFLQQLGQSQGARKKQYDELEQQRTNATGNSKYDEAARLFKISGSLSAPTKTGGFGETISGLSKTLAENAAEQSASEKARQAIREKQFALMDNTGNLKSLAEISKLTNSASSTYGKVATDEGLRPGTPEFAKRVKELHREDVNLKGAKAGVNGPIKLNATENKQREAYSTSSNQAAGFVNKLDEQINRVKKASWYQTGIVGDITSKAGLGLGAEMGAWIKSNAPAQRPSGAGATSDFDAKGYERGLAAGLGQKEVLNVLESAKQAKMNDAMRDQHFTRVVEQRESIADATKLWNTYLRDFPSMKNGKPNLNRPTFDDFIVSGGTLKPPKEEDVGASKKSGAAATAATKPGATSDAKAPRIINQKTVGKKTYYQAADGSWHDKDGE